MFWTDKKDCKWTYKIRLYYSGVIKIKGDRKMLEKIGIVIGILVSIALLVIPFIGDRCPECKGKLIDNDYDKNIGKVIWTSTKCGKQWILY